MLSVEAANYFSTINFKPTTSLGLFISKAGFIAPVIIWQEKKD
jgi:hypothetical protein